MQSQAKPNISKLAFWDVDFDSLDFERDSVFIMDKVFNFGTWEDVKGVFAFYGSTRIKQDVVKVAYWKKKVISFLCVVLELQPQDFTCYERRQSQQQHWDY